MKEQIVERLEQAIQHFKQLADSVPVSSKKGHYYDGIITGLEKALKLLTGEDK